jgi:H+/Cl- antiporter ClcA
MGKTVRNNVYLILFCCIIGAVAGGVIWAFLKIMSLGIHFLWEWLPANYSIPCYTLLVCTVGGVLIGCFRRRFGDYPEELDAVMAKVKAEKTFDYSNMLVLLLSALFPLLLGSSIGPEAGLTGVIVGLCYWIGDNLSFARQNAKEYSQVGVAVTLGVLFRSPLFGVFAVEEENKDKVIITLPATLKVFLYGLAAAAGTGCYMLLSDIFGAGLGALPSFPEMEPELWDYLMLVVYILLGCVLAKFYFLTHLAAEKVLTGLPVILKETVGGACLGAMGMLMPVLMFSGEDAMGELAADCEMYAPLILAAIAFLKVLLTNVCIQSGLKGGHFFPIIFAGVCLGYSAGAMVFGYSGGHMVFAAATVTASLLGGIMKKPLAVTVLLFLCFPVKLFLWIFLAAAAGSMFCSKLTGLLLPA